MSLWASFVLKASVFLGFVIIIQACNILETAKEEKNMQMAEKKSIEQTVKPPMDVSAPFKTGTATFALG